MNINLIFQKLLIVQKACSNTRSTASINWCKLIVILSLVFHNPCWSAEVTTWTSSLVVPAKTIQVYPRSQCHKYWRFLNYLHWWNDRPLTTDRSTRPAAVDGVLVTPGSDLQAVAASLLADAELAKQYHVDGLGSFGSTNYQEPSYEFYLQSLADSGTTEYKHLLEVGGTLADLSYTRKALVKALSSSFSTRIGGKILVSSYTLDQAGPAAIAAQRQNLINEFGSTFVLVVEMTTVAEEMRRLYALGELSVNPSAKLTEVKQVLRQYLDAADGLMVESCHHMEAPTEFRYDNRFNLAFYRDCLIPIFRSVLNEPAYSGKLLGLGAVSGYSNARSGDNNSEECTRRLRNSLEVAINAGPDFIVMAEWNEQNENTSLQPTVNNSWTHQRIIDYYMRALRGLPLAPRSGDDVSIPNCIVSYRKELKLGEALEVELLNVPDSPSAEVYTATLQLEDETGTIVRSFAPVSFTRNIISDRTFLLATEATPNVTTLRPVVTIQQGTAPAVRTFRDGLLYVKVNPTWTRDYQTVKQPLRDIAHVSVANLVVSSSVGRDVVLSGSVTASEPLASVEILADGNEVYGYDRLNEYDLTQNLVISGSFTSLPGGFDGDLTVTGTSGFHFKPVYMPESVIPYQQIGNIIRFTPTERAREWPSRFYLVVPKASRATAVISISSSRGSFQVPVSSLLENGVFSRTLDSQLIFRLEHFHRLADHPVPVDSLSATFTSAIRSSTDHPVYHLRILTNSGRVYRTKPIPVSLAAPMSAVPLSVFSETQVGAVVTVSVPRSDILDLQYEFNQRCGDVLPVTAGAEWFAQLGGGTLYAEPFYVNNGGYPSTNPLSKPSWVTEDGTTCLRFSGNGQYVTLPTESFPRGAFTMTIDLKPMVDTPQILFRHHGILIGSLMLKLVNGTLFASHVDKLVRESSFDTKLTVPTGQWSRIMVSYDLTTLKFQVNQQPTRSYPFSGKALYFQPSVFGGHLRPGFGVEVGDGFFNGFLKGLRISHASHLSAVANTPPVAVTQSLVTLQNTRKQIVLNGTDADADVLISAIVTQPQHGVLTGTPPMVLYTPNDGYIGSDSFTFTVADSLATSAPAIITIVTEAGSTGSTGSSMGGSTNGSESEDGGGGGCGLGGIGAAIFLLAQTVLICAGKRKSTFLIHAFSAWANPRRSRT